MEKLQSNAVYCFFPLFFQNFQSLFGQPLVALLSPETVPTSIESERRKGNLFTLFLHCPLTAYLRVCGLASISLKTWERGQSLVDSFMGECCRILMRARHLGECSFSILGLSHPTRLP